MKQKILKFITKIAIITALFSACCIDSPSWLPTIILAVSLLWILAVLRGSELLRAEKYARKVSK